MTAVVVPVYNGAATIPTTVPSVLALWGVDEWVWVDDGSTDSTARALAEHTAGHPRARVVSLAENRGRSAARNAGVAATDATMLVFLDVDVEPTPDAVPALTAAALAPSAVASVARLAPVVARPQDPYQDYLVHYPRGPAAGEPPGAALDWRFFLSGACAIRRDALTRAGGFAEFIGYGEDVALACALRRVALDGLRLAPTTVRLHGIATLDGALEHAAAFGRALPAIRERCGAEGPVSRLARAQLLAPVARPAAHVVRQWVGRLGPGPVRRKAVRYLLALTMLSAPRA